MFDGREAIQKKENKNPQEDQDGKHSIELEEAMNGTILELPPSPDPIGNKKGGLFRN